MNITEKIKIFTDSTYKNVIVQIQSTIDFVFDISSESKLSFVLMVASINLSLGSGVTTYIGMLQYTQKFVAFVVTVGIQGLLFVASWKLGYAIKNNEKKIILSAIFIICASTSIFFSFSALFDSINSEDIKNNKSRIIAINRINNIYNELSSIINNLQNNKAEYLLKNYDYIKWKKNIHTLLDFALHSETDKEMSSQKELYKIQDELTKTESDKKIILNKISDIEITKKIIFKKISELEQSNSEFFNKINELKVRKKELETKLNIEINSGGTKITTESGKIIFSKHGKGPIAENLQAELNQTITDLEVKKERKNNIEQQILSNKKKIENYISQQTKKNNELQNIKNSESNLNINLRYINRSFSKDKLYNIKKLITKMEYSIDFDLLKEIYQDCEELTNDYPSEISCDYTNFISIFQKENNSKEDIERFNKECRLVPKNLEFVDIIDHARGCINIANNIIDIDEKYFEIVNELNSNYNGKAHHFSLVLTYFADGDHLTQLSLLIAISIDILVLLCGILGTKSKSFLNFNKAEDLKDFGEYPLECILSASSLLEIKDSDSPDIKRIKTILARSTPNNGNGNNHGCSAILDIDKLSDINIHIELGSWRSMDLVRKIDPNNSNIVGLRTKLILWMCDKILCHENSRKVKRSLKTESK